jgi:hypothetical protein
MACQTNYQSVIHHTITHSVVIGLSGRLVLVDRALRCHGCSATDVNASQKPEVTRPPPKKARNPGNRIFKPIPQVNPWVSCLHNTISVQNIRKTSHLGHHRPAPATMPLARCSPRFWDFDFRGEDF